MRFHGQGYRSCSAVIHHFEPVQIHPRMRCIVRLRDDSRHARYPQRAGRNAVKSRANRPAPAPKRFVVRRVKRQRARRERDDEASRYRDRHISSHPVRRARRNAAVAQAQLHAAHERHARQRGEQGQETAHHSACRPAIAITTSGSSRNRPRRRTSPCSARCGRCAPARYPAPGWRRRSRSASA